MASSIQPNLPGYVITEKLGSGTYASVFKAYKTIGSREVLAVKCILKSSLNRVSKENLFTEISILKELKHKYIVDMKDFQWDDKFVYILLEYCLGGDLRSYLDWRHSIGEKTSQKFLYQLAQALEFLHSNKVLHLDLKPSNILLSSQTNPTLKLADFGFAMKFSSASEDTCLRGSLLYMAPEVYQKLNYDGKADLWSTGVILYECLFGQTPFHSTTIEELKFKINSPLPIKIPSTPRISSECSDVLGGLLHRNPLFRINLQHFVTHPFVTADFMPIYKKIQKATDLVQLAASKESEGLLDEAIDTYCKAVRLYIRVADEECDENKKRMLKEKVLRFVERAEVLKSKLLPIAKVNSFEEKNSYEKLVLLSQSKSSLTAAVRNIDHAFFKEEGKDFEAALTFYEKAIELLLMETKKNLDVQEKKIIRDEAARLLTRAEALKKYLSINANVEANLQNINENDSHCILQ